MSGLMSRIKWIMKQSAVKIDRSCKSHGRWRWANYHNSWSHWHFIGVCVKHCVPLQQPPVDPSYSDAKKRGRVAYLKSLLQIYDSSDTKASLWSRHWRYEPERKVQHREWVRKGGNPPKIAEEKSISEEGTVHDLPQLKRNHVTMTTGKEEERHWEILQRVCAC